MPMYDFECQTCHVTKGDVLAKSDETLTCECGGTMTHTLATHMVTRNDIPGGLWLENYGPHPIKVYSHSERRRLLKQPRFDKTTGAEYYLTEKVEHVENPQTGKSPHTSNWSSRIDAVTLENARQLVMRPSERFLPMTSKEERDAEQAERDYHDPLHHELNYTGDNAAAILAQVTKMERH